MQNPGQQFVFEMDHDPFFKEGTMRLVLDPEKAKGITDPGFAATYRIIRNLLWFQDFIRLQEKEIPIRTAMVFNHNQQWYKIIRVQEHSGQSSMMEIQRGEGLNKWASVTVGEFEKTLGKPLHQWLTEYLRIQVISDFPAQYRDSLHKAESQEEPSFAWIEKKSKNFSEKLHSVIKEYQDLHRRTENEIQMIEHFIPTITFRETTELHEVAQNSNLLFLTELLHLDHLRRQDEEIRTALLQIEKMMEMSEKAIQQELNLLELKLEERREWASRVHELEKELELHHRETARLQKTQEKHKLVLEEGLQDKLKLENIEKQIEENKIQLAKEQSVVEKLRGSICPYCETKLTQETQEALLATHRERMDEMNARIFQLQVEAEELKNKIKKLRTQYAVLEKELHRQPRVWHQYYVTEQHLQMARKQEKEYHTLKEEADRLKYMLQNRSFARKEEQSIRDLKKKLDALNYRPARWIQMMEQLRESLPAIVPPATDSTDKPNASKPHNQDFSDVLKILHKWHASEELAKSDRVPNRIHSPSENEKSHTAQKYVHLMQRWLSEMLEKKKKENTLRLLNIQYLEQIKFIFAHPEKFSGKTEWIGELSRQLTEWLYDGFYLPQAIHKESYGISPNDNNYAKDMFMPFRSVTEMLAWAVWEDIFHSLKPMWRLIVVPFSLQDTEFIHKLHALKDGMFPDRNILFMLIHAPRIYMDGWQTFRYENAGIRLISPTEAE